MTKLIVAASTAIALLGIATIGLVASEGAALAKPPTGFVCEITGYYYSVEEPEWSTRGVPCWRPWEMNPMLKFAWRRGFGPASPRPFVIPAEAGIQRRRTGSHEVCARIATAAMDPGFRRGDEEWRQGPARF